MKKTLMASLAAAGMLLCAGTAQARVAWSIGIDAPGVATVVSNGPVYREAPVYVAPPVVYAPPPGYGPPPGYAPPPVYAPVRRYAPPPGVRYAPAPIGYFVPPPPVVVYPGFAHPGWHRWHGWEHRDGAWDGRR